MTKTELQQRIPFNMDSPFVQLYFGKDKKRLVSYNEFSQFLHDFHEEYAIEGFRRADKEGTGFISLLDFQDIMINIKSHLLTKQVQSHLIEVMFWFYSNFYNSKFSLYIYRVSELYDRQYLVCGKIDKKALYKRFRSSLQLFY